MSEHANPSAAQVAARPCFNDPGLHAALDASDDATLDALDFGAIGIDKAGIVRRYNACESRLAGLSAERVVGKPLFTQVAPCMNNVLVARRFEAALAGRVPLDATLDYVLTLRMRPVKVTLRLLTSPDQPTGWVLVRRLA